MKSGDTCPSNIPDELSEISESLKEHSFDNTGRIYFLLNAGCVVYVGQSVQLDGRIRQHKCYKSFDRVLYIDVPVDRLTEVERYWIDKLRPKLNLECRKPAKADAELARLRHMKSKLAIDFCKLVDASGFGGGSILRIQSLPPRTIKALLVAGIWMVSQLSETPEWQLISLRGIGETSLVNLRAALAGGQS